MNRDLRAVRWIGSIGLALVAGVASGYVAIVNKTDHSQIHVVPAPGPVTIDGSLDEWDLSGAILMFLDESSKDVYSVRGAMMYDAEYLYVGAQVKDPTPMVNNYAFGGDFGLSWNADAIQLRFLAVPGAQSHATLQGGARPPPEMDRRINHITLWYSTVDQAAGYFVCYGMGFTDPALNPEGVVGAFQADASSTGSGPAAGYSMEYKIPWSVLRAERPFAAGDTAQVQWQLHWGNDLGTDVRCGMTDVRNPASGDLGYMGPVSWGMAIFEAEGHLELPERTILGRAAGHIPIPFTLERDGKVSLAIRNAGGQLIRTCLGAQPYGAGEHTYLWDGLDDFDRSVAPGAYTAHLLTHDGIKQKYVTNIGVSGTPPYQTEDGTGGWAGDYRFPQTIGIEGDAVILGTASAEAAPYSIRTNLDGIKQYGTRAHGHAVTLHEGFGYMLSAGGAKITKFDVENGLLAPFAGGKPETVVTTRREGETARQWSDRSWQMYALTVAGDRIVVSSRSEDKLYLLDLVSGEARGAVALANPYGLTVAPDGALYAVSGNAIGRYDLDPQRFLPIIDNLDAPRQLACDADGNLYVTLQGETMQVWKLSPAGGILLRYGTPGGRPLLGAFERNGMLNPYGLGVDNNGRLWVAEADAHPKRYSVWNPDGSLWRDFFGSLDYATRATIDPEQPEYIYLQSVRYRVDYEAGTWEVDATVLRPAEDNGVRFGIESGHAGGIFANVEGRKFLWARDAAPGPVMYEWVEDRFVPRMAFGSPAKDNWWIDDNNDGRVQEAEIRQGPSLRGIWLGHPIDRHLNIYWHQGVQWHGQGGARTTQPYTMVRWDFLGFNEHGGLMYGDPTQPTAIATDADGGAVSCYTPDADGNLFVLVSGGTLERGTREQGSGHRVVGFSAAGAKMWEYHKAHCAFAWTSDAYRPGDLVGVCSFPTAPTRNLVALTGYYGQYFLLDSRSGLFVDALGEDQRSAYTLDHHMVLTENFNGTLFTHRDNGRTYFIGGDADARLWELTGLDTIQYQNVDVIVTPAQVELAEIAARRNFLAQRQAIGRQTVTIPRLRHAAVDGRYDEWTQAPVLNLVMENDRTAQVQVGYDDANLYLLFQVGAVAPFLNAPTDPRLLFKSGSSVEVQLGTELDKRSVRGQNQQEMRKGDLRLILARTADGKTIATRYRWKVADTDKPHAYTFESPTGKEQVEEVMTVDDVTLHHAATVGGYTIEAAIPWHIVDVEPASGLAIAGDFGVIFGNIGGTRNAIRHMWSDKSPEVSINNDIPSEVRIHPNQWGTWMLE